jgi:hypothetical protein
MGHSRSSGGAGLQARIAPAQASSIVHAYLDRLPYFSLHQVPVEGHVPQPGVEHHGRTSRANTLDVQTIAAYIDEPPRGWICLGVALGGNRLVGDPDGRQAHDQGEYHRYPATYASQHPPAQGPRSNTDVCLPVVLVVLGITAMVSSSYVSPFVTPLVVPPVSQRQ